MTKVKNVNMASWIIQRKRTLYYCLLFGIGSVLPDTDHFISLITGKENLWGIFHHNPYVSVIIGIFVTSSVGLLANLVLKRKS
jgi:hypothetical protein